MAIFRDTSALPEKKNKGRLEGLEKRQREVRGREEQKWRGRAETRLTDH